jgi:hypothetical protein
MENQAQMTWIPWKFATIGIAAVITTALVTGLVVANWNGSTDSIMEPKKSAAAVSSGTPRNETGVRTSRGVSRGANTVDVLEKAVIGAGVGAGGGAIAGGGSDASKGAAIGGVIGATAGTLYGLHDK